MEKKTGLFVILGPLIGIAILLFAAWWFGWREPPLPEGLIQANGRIEGDHYTVAGKWPGRVAELQAREGEQVEQGRILLKLDDSQTVAKLNQAKAAVHAITA